MPKRSLIRICQSFHFPLRFIALVCAELSDIYPTMVEQRFEPELGLDAPPEFVKFAYINGLLLMFGKHGERQADVSEWLICFRENTFPAIFSGLTH